MSHVVAPIKACTGEVDYHKRISGRLYVTADSKANALGQLFSDGGRVGSLLI